MEALVHTRGNVKAAIKLLEDRGVTRGPVVRLRDQARGSRSPARAAIIATALAVEDRLKPKGRHRPAEMGGPVSAEVEQFIRRNGMSGRFVYSLLLVRRERDEQ